MKMKICVSIPVKFTNLSDGKLVIEKVLNFNPNLIELRFDYIPNLDIISSNFLRELLTYIPPHFNVIFTFRDSSEGGQIEIEPQEHFKIMKAFVDTKPDYIDIEMNTKEDLLKKIIDLASQNGIKLIFSHHNLEKTLMYDEVVSLIKDFQKRIFKSLPLNSKIIKNSIFKIVFKAHSFEDNLIALKICETYDNLNQKIISFCSGVQGIFSRIMCVFSGSFMTYASLEEETAPGQLNIHKMREIYKIISN
ncbi:MAG: type I 3-dehydroquinate dehydratase [Promethearchaeota archaeon]